MAEISNEVSEVVEMNFKPPKASEVIAVLNKMIDEHGDKPVCLLDPDTTWLMPIGLKFDDVEINQGLILVTSGYYGDVDGCIGEGYNAVNTKFKTV